MKEKQDRGELSVHMQDDNKSMRMLRGKLMP